MAAARDNAAEAAARRVLLDCVELDGVNSTRFAEQALSVSDWGSLFRRAEVLGALPPLLWTLGRTDLLRQLPLAAQEAAQHARQQIAVHATLLMRDASLLSAALTRAGIEHVFLKGTALLARHYPDPTARHIDDIDILIAAKDRPRTEQMFAGMDIIQRRRPQAVLDALHPGRYREQQHDTPSGTNIDLHWQEGGDDELRALLARAERSEVHGVHLPIPHPLDLFTQLCSHVIVHHGAHQKYLLRHIADLRVLLSNTSIGKTQIARWLAHPRTSVSVSVSLALLAGRDGGPCARATELMVFPPRAVARLRDQATHLERLAERTFLASRRPRALFGHLFPPRSYVAKSFGVAPTSPLLPGLYAARLLRLPFVPLPR